MNTIRRIALMGCLLPALVPACTINPATGARELIIISEEEEIALGNDAAPEFEKEFGGKVANARLQDYVSRVGQAVAARSERKMPYAFTLVNSEVPNAFALPGGKIFITAGLMRMMANERELAAVLGHEVGHVSALHNVKGLQRQLGVELLAKLASEAVGGKGGQAAQIGTQIVGGMVNLRYGRNDEYQADDLGIRYMTKAGYSPWGMAELLKALVDLSASSGGKTPEMLSTHPDPENRVKRASKTIQEKHPDFAPAAADPKAGTFLEMRSLLPAARPG